MSRNASSERHLTGQLTLDNETGTGLPGAGIILTFQSVLGLPTMRLSEMQKTNVACKNAEAAKAKK